MYHYFPENDRTVWGKEEMRGTLILNEKENIYYLKTKLSHSEQIWINITLDCLEEVLGQ